MGRWGLAVGYVLDLILNAIVGALAAAVLGVILARIPGVRAWLLRQSPVRIALLASVVTALFVSGLFVIIGGGGGVVKEDSEIVFLKKLTEPAANSVNEARIAMDAGAPGNENWFECGKHSKISFDWAGRTQRQISDRLDALLKAVKP